MRASKVLKSHFELNVYCTKKTFSFLLEIKIKYKVEGCRAKPCKLWFRASGPILKTVPDKYGSALGAQTTLNATLSTCRKVSHLKSTKGRFLGEICDLFDF